MDKPKKVMVKKRIIKASPTLKKVVKAKSTPKVKVDSIVPSRVPLSDELIQAFGTNDKKDALEKIIKLAAVCSYLSDDGLVIINGQKLNIKTDL